MDRFTANGYEIHSWYEGISAWAVFKDGKEVYHGWCLDELIERIGFNPYDFKEE